MNKNLIWIALVVVVVLAGGYAFKHQIKTLVMGGTGLPAPTDNSAASYPVGNSVDSAPMITPPADSGTIISTKTGAKGSYLVSSTGMSLYTFDKDTSGVSNCSGSCLGIWPAYTTATLPPKLPANVGSLTRSDDGSIQFTYKNRPLYYYSSDSQPGDTNGDGVGGIWHLAKP